MNPLRALHDAGQSIWLDFLRRSLVSGGGLDRLMREDAVTGVTSNPSIFGKAIGGSTDYDDAIKMLASEGRHDPRDVFYELAEWDIRYAADVFRPVYDDTGGADGYVSFELEPDLAHDADGSVRAALELVPRFDRPNVMIKVPGTEEGVPAVEELTAAGVNVNITLLFSVRAYEAVAQAYVRGLDRRLAAGKPVDTVASVASFFVSRVDTEIDSRLPEGSPFRGKGAIANAKMAYRRFREIFSGEQWERLAAAGARVQRPLWASTSTKDPAYPDVLYVESLIGPDTVNTMPQATLDAFRDHGTVNASAIMEDVEEAEADLVALAGNGIDLDEVTAKLLADGIEAFDKDLAALLETIAGKIEKVRAGRARWTATLGTLDRAVSRRRDRIAADDVVARIWRKDHTVWKPDPTEITNRLGWLTVAEKMRERIPELELFAKQAAADGLTDAVLLGMGGSSLAPEVLKTTFGVADGGLDLHILDSTHPATIARVEEAIDPARTLFLVASKSGTTVETLSHFAHFWERTGGRGPQFVAITDPGTPLEDLAGERGFRASFLNPDDIGGRYSALSFFGLVPGALIGADLVGLLESGEEMATACDSCVFCEENPGAWLGAVLGEAALAGRDKLTLVLPDEVAGLGAWIEQLIAESTGKEGKGILPVDGEDLGPPDAYGEDRLFVALGDHGGLGAVEEAGHPVVRLAYDGPGQLGAEFFRWEFATAVAGHVLGINAFDQPNVQEAKDATSEILAKGAGEEPGLDDLAALLESVRPGDYVAIHAFLDATSEVREALHRARLAIRDRYRVATTVGVGPRFLHSTGQLHKGGPDTGVFVQVTDGERDRDLPVPGKEFTFGRLIDAQALGDLQALRSRGRRVGRVTVAALEEIA